MKNKWLWVGGLLGFFIFSVSTVSWCITNIFISTNTATHDILQVLCSQYAPGLNVNGIVHTICVNTGVSGTFTLYNSSASVVNPVAAINTSTVGCQIYDVVLSSGITYTNSATANVTVSYQCY